MVTKDNSDHASREVFILGGLRPEWPFGGSLIAPAGCEAHHQRINRVVSGGEFWWLERPSLLCFVVASPVSQEAKLMESGCRIPLNAILGS